MLPAQTAAVFIALVAGCQNSEHRLLGPTVWGGVPYDCWPTRTSREDGRIDNAIWLLACMAASTKLTDPMSGSGAAVGTGGGFSGGGRTPVMYGKSAGRCKQWDPLVE